MGGRDRSASLGETGPLQSQSRFHCGRVHLVSCALAVLETVQFLSLTAARQEFTRRQSDSPPDRALPAGLLAPGRWCERR